MSTMLTGARVQFCRDGWDISSEPGCENVADEIRFWVEDDPILSLTPHDDGWWVTGSAYGIPSEMFDVTYPTPQDALIAYCQL